jgi:quinol monooxygenase YgiN
MSIRVVARIQARPEVIEEVRKILLAFIEPARKEEGCIAYELMQNNGDPCDFTFVEEWTSDAALDAHLQTPHLKDGAAKLANLLSVAPDIRRYSLLA